MTMVPFRKGNRDVLSFGAQPQFSETSTIHKPWISEQPSHCGEAIGPLDIIWLVVEKYESQLGLLFPIYGKIENVPNHQPVMFVS